MSTDHQSSTALARAKRLVQLYQERRITEASVISGIAELAAPDNVDEIVALLPPELEAEFGEWVRRLPSPDSSRVVFWPLPDVAVRALSEWMRTKQQREASSPRYPKEEFARRGDAIYERILPVLVPGDEGKTIAIDIETGEYEVDADESAAADRLIARIPDAQVWVREIGSRYARHFGPRAVQVSP
jgi:hypothetical protein